jgi:hypothetical protein
MITTYIGIKERGKEKRLGLVTTFWNADLFALELKWTTGTNKSSAFISYRSLNPLSVHRSHCYVLGIHSVHYYCLNIA